MSLQLVMHATPHDFCAVALPLLLRHEADYCTHIGVVLRMRDHGYVPAPADLAQPLLMTVQSGDHVELAAIQTMKTKILLSRGSDEAMHCLADALAAQHSTVRGIVGLVPSVETFVNRFAANTGRRAHLAYGLRTFQLTTVCQPVPVPGHMHLCTENDIPIAADFASRFSIDIGAGPLPDPIADARRFIDQQRLYFWVDQQPVAVAGWSGLTPSGVRINAVYTPEPFRNRGYASNLVAALSQQLLNTGRKFCFLHTDLANPTSNSIYQKLGYRAVCDGQEWELDGP